MSNKISVTVGVPIVFDGTSTTVEVDLAKDPFVVTGGAPNGDVEQLGQLVNWFVNTPEANAPTGILDSGSVGGTGVTFSSASISGTVVSITLPSAPAAGGAELVFYLTFD